METYTLREIYSEIDTEIDRLRRDIEQPEFDLIEKDNVIELWYRYDSTWEWAIGFIKLADGNWIEANY